jgi:hypothetical protein
MTNAKERLRELGIEYDDELEDLRVEAGETIDLDIRTDRFRRNLRQLSFTSIEEAKRLIGVPDEAINDQPDFKRMTAVSQPKFEDASPIARRIPKGLMTPIVGDPGADARLYDMSAAYVFGDSRLVDRKYVTILDDWIKSMKVNISIFIYADIYVAKNATLNLLSTSLFANYITVEQSGQIKFKSGAQSRVYAAGFKGL